MSWLSESFVDSLNSLKGQIIKIKKDVLAEDFDENEDEMQSIKLQIKELDSLCSSKDLEITSLQDENQKITQRFQEEINLLRNENKRLKENCNTSNRENILISDDQIQQVCELEDQLQQLKIERDHYQSNICHVIQQRDNYKHELEKLKQSFSDLQVEKNKILENQSDKLVTNNLSDVNLREMQVKNDEVINLRNIVEKLQIQIESYQNEKEETSRVIESHMLNSEGSKEKIEKLLEEIKILNSEKENAELENQKLRDTIENMKSDFSDKVKKFETEQKHRYELEENLVKLSHMLETNKNEQLNFNTDMKNKIENLLKVFNINVNEDNIDDISYNKTFDLIEEIWTNNLKERKKIENLHNENIGKLQNEVQELKNEIINLENEIKIKTDKTNELELSYKKEIDSLQSKYLELKTQERENNVESQINEVKRLNEELSKLMKIIETKNIELTEGNSKVNEITQELNEMKNNFKNSEDQLSLLLGEKEKCEEEILHLKNELKVKQMEIADTLTSKKYVEEKCRNFESENAQILQQNNSLLQQLNENKKMQKDLEENVQNLKKMTEKAGDLEKELCEIVKSKTELERICAEMQQVQLRYQNQTEHLKAEIIIKESNLTELNKEHQLLKDEFKKMRDETSKLNSLEEEFNRWKETMVDLEIQREDLLEQKQILENECADLRIQLSELKKKEEEIERLQCENANLIESYNKLLSESRNNEVEEIKNAEHIEESELRKEMDELTLLGQQQVNIIANLSYENNELKHHIQTANETMMNLKEENMRLKQDGNGNVPDESDEAKRTISFREKINMVHQHRRSKSDADFDNKEVIDNAEVAKEVRRLKELSLQQLNDYKILQEQYAKVTEKEAHSRKELERLRLHLIEIENDYTETIDEYKTKLNATEEQLKNSSTFYTSTKVRDNQHLESLQSQLRLMSVQRDDLQAKLSAAEDEVQKHKAALTSFHVVLEHFQQDKEREMESVVTKYEHQLLMTEKKFAELQQEINSLSSQLSEAKNGLKAASRLGEQLERKSQQIIEQEKELAAMKAETLELQKRSAMASQSNFNKVDKSLIKNLLLGYLMAQQADRKAQVLRIMVSVLDFDQEERNKLEIDSSQTSGWLSTLLHPKSDGAQPSQSLSEAFIRFLENESRPQPQLKLLPERSSQGEKSRSSNTTPKPSLLLQELVLPTFNSPQSNESTILKDVLKES